MNNKRPLSALYPSMTPRPETPEELEVDSVTDPEELRGLEDRATKLEQEKDEIARGIEDVRAALSDAKAQQPQPPTDEPKGFWTGLFG